MRRPDETPTLNVVANMLGGLFVGLLLISLGAKFGDDNLADLGD